MKDPFEKYFDKNREALDSRQPNEQAIWYGVEQGLHQKKGNRSMFIWRAAAILLAFVTVAQLTYIMTSQAKSHEMELALIGTQSGAFGSLEASYNQELVLLENRLAEKEVNPEEYELFYEEMKFINQVEDEFKQEIPLTNNREKLAGILIDTYEKKIQLLERMLQQVERNETQKKQLDEGLMPMKKNHKTLAI